MSTWGDTTVETNGWNLGNLIAYAGGTAPAGASNVVSAIFLYATSAATYRVALYSGGASGDPSGATLLEDLGTFAHGGTGWESINSTTTPTLPNGTRLWIAFENSAFNGPKRNAADFGTSDFDSVVTAAGNNANPAFADPAPSTTYTEQGTAPSVYIVYSASGGSSVDATLRGFGRGFNRGFQRGMR